MVVIIMLNLLLLVQFPRIFASGSLQSKACGTYHISVSSKFGHDLFHINGELVEKGSFCKSLKFYQENHCFFTRNVGIHYCGLDISLGMLLLVFLNCISYCMPSLRERKL